MKKLTKIITYILILVFILVGCNMNSCKSDNEGLCELEVIKQFEVEKDAKIVVGVFNEDYGKDLVNSWNDSHSDYKDLLSFEIISNYDSEALLSHISEYDLIQMKSENVPLYLDYLSGFDESFADILENEQLQKFSNQINQEAYYFMPFDAEGLLFAYNKTMLQEFGVDLTDQDNNGLPDSIESFEKIAEMAEVWRKDKKTYLDESIENIFAFPLNDQIAMLPFLQNNDYRLIQGVSAEMMDLDQGLILALENLQTLGSFNWRLDKKLDNDTRWNYEKVLERQSAPFLLVGNWMYYDHFQTSKAYELVFSKLPSLNGTDLAPISSVSGFVLNKDSKYPEAVNMVLQHIKSAEGTQVAINNGIVPLVNRELLKVDGFKIDENTKQQIIAYQYSELAPLQAFEQNPIIRGWDLLLEKDLRLQMREVFLGIKEPEVVAKEIRMLIGEWLSDQKIIIEGVNDKEVPDSKDDDKIGEQDNDKKLEDDN